MRQFILTAIAVVFFVAALWFSIGYALQAKAEAARQEEQAARQAAANLRQVAEATMQYAQARATELQNASPAGNGGDGELAAFEFLVGTWRGEVNGGIVEEIWSRPKGNAMMGMFRWLNADRRSRMYELLTISREGEETFLRLRHFTPQMVAWEEKDMPVVLRLTEQSPGRAVFVNISEEDRMARIVFHQSKPETLGIDVEFREDSGRAPLNFRFMSAQEGRERIKHAAPAAAGR